MLRIVFLDRSTIEASIRAPGFAHEWVDYSATAAEEVVERLRGAQVAVVNKVRLDRAALLQLPGLRMIAICATGADNVDLAAAREGGLVVSNIRGYARHAVPEHVFALALALRRNLLAYRQDLRGGLWQRSEQFCLFTHPIRDLAGSTLGIIGRGVLGESVAALGRAFQMNILFAEHKGARDVRPDYASFDQVLAASDVLTLHCPLTPVTRGLIGTAELARMKPSAILVNTARGGLVEEAALARALRDGVIAGAGFDVLALEPPRDGNPLLELDLPNFILTPHVAWASDRAMQAMADQLVENIEAFVAGTPRNRVV